MKNREQHPFLETVRSHLSHAGSMAQQGHFGLSSAREADTVCYFFIHVAGLDTEDFMCKEVLKSPQISSVELQKNVL